MYKFFFGLLIGWWGAQALAETRTAATERLEQARSVFEEFQSRRLPEAQLPDVF